MGDGIKTLGELMKEQETIDYWKERLTESGQTNTRLRSELDAAKFELRDLQRISNELNRTLEFERTLLRAMAKAVERFSES